MRFGDIVNIADHGKAVFLGLGRDGAFVFREIDTAEQFDLFGPIALAENDSSEVDSDEASEGTADDSDATPDGEEE